MEKKIILSACILLSVICLFASNDNKQDTITTESGLKYIIINKSAGEKTADGKEIGLHGIGSFLTNGEVFWETRESNNPFYFVMGTNSVIKGCEEGVGLMRKGDRYVFIMPPDLAYGEKGRDNIPSNATLVFDYEVFYIGDPKMSLIDTLYSEIENNSIESAIKLYYNLKVNHAEKYNFREDELNNLGYKIINKMLPEAIEIFKLNVKMYPESFNVYDSLGDAYMRAGNTEQAILNYEKSLELFPKNMSAIKALKKLRAKE